MYARVTTAIFQRDKFDDAVNYFRDHLAEIRQQRGNRDLLFLLDHASGKSLIVTLWESDADREASESSGYYAARMKELAQYLIGQPTRDVFEVTVDESAGKDQPHFVRATTLPLQVDKIDEAIRVMNTSVVPAARQQQAWRRLLSLGDRASGKAITFSFWENEATLRASESDGFYQAQVAKILPLSAGQPTREFFDVAAQAAAPVPMGQPQQQPHAPSP